MNMTRHENKQPYLALLAFEKQATCLFWWNVIFPNSAAQNTESEGLLMDAVIR